MKTYFVAVVGIVALVALAAGFALDRVVLPALAPDQNVEMGQTSYASSKWKMFEIQFTNKTTGRTVGFSFSYPRDFDAKQGQDASGGFMGTSVVQVRFPQDAYQNPPSNFAEAYLTVSQGSDQKSNTACFDFSGLERQNGQSHMQTVNGVVYQFATSTGVGAGNIYDSRVYRTQYQQRCFEFVLTVHTGNINNYGSGTVVAFDQSRAFAILDQIFQSVHFSNSTQ